MPILITASSLLKTRRGAYEPTETHRKTRWKGFSYRIESPVISGSWACGGASRAGNFVGQTSALKTSRPDSRKQSAGIRQGRQRPALVPSPERPDCRVTKIGRAAGRGRVG